MNWIKITSLKDWEVAKEKSFQNTIIVFKHSTTCSISLATLARFERQWNNEKPENIDAYFLDLLSFRPISNQIALDTAVTHQSPQLIVIKNGSATYNASHNGINVEDIIEM